MPPSQRAIRERCVHPTGRFVAFPREDVERTLTALLARQVVRSPERLAVQSRHGAMSYGELDRAANGVARALRERLDEGAEPVGLLFEPGGPAIAAALGVLKVGKICVPLDPSLPWARINHIVEDSGARLLLTNARHATAAREAAARVVVVDGLDSTSDGAMAAGLSADDVAYLLYTSGTTGPPKGVAHSHRSLLHLEMNYTNALHICADDRLAGLRSPSVFGGVRDLWAALLTGAALYPLDVKREGVAPLAAWLREREITIAFFGAPLFRHLAATLDGGDTFPRLRVIRLGSDTVHKSDVELYRRHFAPTCVLVNGLGATETGSACKFFIDRDTSIDTATVPIGYPLEGMRVLVLDDDDREVGDGEVGELAVQSRYLAVGYWRRAELTATAFRAAGGGAERRYRTGNLARRHADGCVEHVGRRDFQVKVRGHRVEVGEIEAALMGLEAIREAVVTARPDAAGDTRLTAYVVPDTPLAPTATAIRRALAGSLPDHMIPAEFVTLDRLPLNANNKIDRGALPRPPGTRPFIDASFVAPRTPLEATLAAIWAEVLGLDQVGVHDPFLELGGDSLLATRVVARVMDALGVEMPIRVLLESPTIAVMAAALDSITRPRL